MGIISQTFNLNGQVYMYRALPGNTVKYPLCLSHAQYLKLAHRNSARERHSDDWNLFGKGSQEKGVHEGVKQDKEGEEAKPGSGLR